MSALPSQEPARGRASCWSTIVRQLLTGVGGVLVLLSPIVLCLAAGRWSWLAGWLTGLTLVISVIVSRVPVAVKSPGLVAERARWAKGESAEGWDQPLLPIVGAYGPLAVLVVAGLDEHAGWPPAIAPWVQVVAFALVLAGQSWVPDPFGARRQPQKPGQYVARFFLLQAKRRARCPCIPAAT